ncbi:hypothetical protein Patl1_31407 [Pistacia atlantica]|uniref:Uncharacterized protein n=1 Tax=Pistacia atlantica TaxID=434234 RepID=A0ACC1ANP2_9ROSI|nr:hypothetical protein Patl1_31407 [Pistacia atlantica]
MAMGVVGFFCFFFFLLFPILAQSQTQPTSFIFQDFRQGETNLSLDGDASIIRPSGLLRLTKRSNNVIGHTFYVNPIQMFEKNSSSSAQNAYSFSTTFVFEIVSPSSGHGGYGLAFLLAPSKQLPGADSGHYLGIFNPTNDGKASNHVIFVEFDTVNGFKGESDDDGNHVGVGINSMNSRSKPAAYYHNPGDTDHQEEVNLEGNGPIQAWIEYDGEEKVLNVTICYAGNPKPVKPLINYQGINPRRPYQRNYVCGILCVYGDRSSSHYISGWSFSLNGEPEALNVSALPTAPKEKESTPYNPQTVAIISSLCAVTVLLLGILVFFLFYKRSPTSEILEDWEVDCPHRFRYKDLYEATKGFRE